VFLRRVPTIRSWYHIAKYHKLPVPLSTRALPFLFTPLKRAYLQLLVTCFPTFLGSMMMKLWYHQHSAQFGPERRLQRLPALLHHPRNVIQMEQRGHSLHYKKPFHIYRPGRRIMGIHYARTVPRKEASMGLLYTKSTMNAIVTVLHDSLKRLWNSASG
jgi:hypothetical protein